MPRDLLVPGTSGNKLLLNGEDIGWPGLLTAQAFVAGKTGYTPGLDGTLLTADELEQILTMEYANPASWKPTRSSLKPGGAMTPGAVLGFVYNQLTDFERFEYDFRADIRQSAENLLDQLVAGAAGGANRWRLVAHSQGGLIVAAASKRYAEEHGDDDSAFSRLCSHVAFVAVPFYGTVNAAAALITGEDLGAGFKVAFRRLARTWPSLHQMLPAWPGSVMIATPNGLQRAPFNALDPRAWPNQGLSTEMLLRARVARTGYLNDPLSRMNGVNKRILMSRAYPTGNHLLLSNGEVTLPTNFEVGDSLVAEETTFRMQGQIEQEVTHAFGSNGDTMRHFALCNDPFVATEVKSFFAQ